MAGAVDHALRLRSLWIAWLLAMLFHVDLGLMPLFHGISPEIHGHVETAQLPLVHHDPFDRLLIAQARVEGLMAVSSDGHWPGYAVSLHRV